MVYQKGDLEIGERYDSRDGRDWRDDHERVYGAYLEHSCNEWVIGGSVAIRALIADLEIALVEVEAREKDERKR
jgi:hypothetical protein